MGFCTFVSPSGRIGCQVDHNYYSVPDSVYCQWDNHPATQGSHSATLYPNGSFDSCYQASCSSGNWGASYPPTLAYGSAVSLGPFTCSSDTGGVTCTAGGRGFLINSDGVFPVG